MSEETAEATTPEEAPATPPETAPEPAPAPPPAEPQTQQATPTVVTSAPPNVHVTVNGPASANAGTRANSAASRHPAHQLGDGASTASGLLGYLERCRRHESAATSAYHEAAGVLYAAIRRSKNVPFGTRALTARRVQRALMHAGDLAAEQARAMSAAARIVRMIQPEKPSRRDFDPGR